MTNGPARLTDGPARFHDAVNEITSARRLELHGRALLPLLQGILTRMRVYSPLTYQQDTDPVLNETAGT